MDIFDEVLGKDKTRKRLEVDLSAIKLQESKEGLLRPSDIVTALDKVVSGQDTAKRELAILYANHLALLKYNKENPDPQKRIKKSNIFLIGESGTGKTFLVEKLAELFSLDLYSVDATTLTKAGYKGEDVDGILYGLSKQCNNDSDRINRSIVFVDEADKLMIAPDAVSSDFGGGQIQRELLKIIEGFNGSENVLWIFSGSFNDYIKSQKELRKPKKSIGLSGISQKEDTNKPYIFNDDEMIKAGFIPEFVGRIGRIIQLNRLTKDDFRNILCNIDNSIVSQYERLGKIRNINLKLSKKDIDLVIEKSYTDNVGARSLKKRVEELLFERMYN